MAFAKSLVSYVITIVNHCHLWFPLGFSPFTLRAALMLGIDIQNHNAFTVLISTLNTKLPTIYKHLTRYLGDAEGGCLSMVSQVVDSARRNTGQDTLQGQTLDGGR